MNVKDKAFVKFDVNEEMTSCSRGKTVWQKAGIDEMTEVLLFIEMLQRISMPFTVKPQTKNAGGFEICSCHQQAH